MNLSTKEAYIYAVAPNLRSHINDTSLLQGLLRCSMFKKTGVKNGNLRPIHSANGVKSML